MVNFEKSVNGVFGANDLGNCSNEELADLYYKYSKVEYDGKYKVLLDKITTILIEKNTGIINRMARGYYIQYRCNFDDLVQAGRFAFFDALNHYDPSKAVGSFINYACIYINRYMKDENRESRNVKVPKAVYDLIFKLKQIWDDFMYNFGRKPTKDELAQKMGVEVEMIETLLMLQREAVSLNSDIGCEESANSEILDLLCCKDDRDILEYIEGKDLLRCVDELFGRILTAREYFILKHKKFLEHTSKETIEALILNGFGNISHQRVDQICEKALSKILENDRFVNLLISNGITFSETMNGAMNEIKIDKEKQSLNRKRLTIRKNFQSSGECVNILKYYNCSEEQFLEALLKLKDDARKKYIGAIGAAESYMNVMIDPNVFKQPDIKTVEVKMNTLLNNIVFNDLYNQNEKSTVKVLK